MEKRQDYESPEMRVFTVHLHGNCCQSLSGGVPQGYPGNNLGADFDSEYYF